jgi:hypothetical protein
LKLAELRIPGVKIVAAEFTFDGTRLSFLYSTEAEGKVDLRRLQTAMQRTYPRPRIEMRQIGPRDVAKMLGGMGACGLENRCCSMFLTEFSPISIKMAKEQGISLTPTEITGMCGRLRCCLIYEYDQYVEARKTLPKRNKRVVTPSGEGKVWDVYPLKQTVIVELDSGTRAEFNQADLQPWDELEALRRKSQEPCDRHEGGECTCGKADAPTAVAKPAEEVDFEELPGESIDLNPPLPDVPQPLEPALPPRPPKQHGQGQRPPQAQHQNRPQNQAQGQGRSAHKKSNKSRPKKPHSPNNPPKP